LLLVSVLRGLQWLQKDADGIPHVSAAAKDAVEAGERQQDSKTGPSASKAADLCTPTALVYEAEHHAFIHCSVACSSPAARPVACCGVGRCSPTAMLHEHSIWNHLPTSRVRASKSHCIDLFEVGSISHVCASDLARACAQNKGVPARMEHSQLRLAGWAPSSNCSFHNVHSTVLLHIVRSHTISTHPCNPFLCPFFYPASCPVVPAVQRRSYFDSADYFLEVQGGNPQKPSAAVDTKVPSSTVSTAAPSTPLQQQQQQQVLPMKLQPCKHVSQPSRLSVRS
jgi:hypothetical protein